MATALLWMTNLAASSGDIGATKKMFGGSRFFFRRKGSEGMRKEFYHQDLQNTFKLTLMKKKKKKPVTSKAIFHPSTSTLNAKLCTEANP